MGKYKVVRELGRNQEGGRITYLATDTSLEPPQQVVIKEFRFAASGANWSGFKTYEREIAILQHLEHPRILQTIVNKWYAMDSYMLLIENGNFVFTVAIPGGQWGTSIKVLAKVTPDVWTQWTHIAGVYDGQMLLLYINGQLVA